MTLYQECIDALCGSVEVPSEVERKELVRLFEQKIPFTSWGRIDWNIIEDKIIINDAAILYELLDKRILEFDPTIYVVWDEGALPIIRTDIEKCIQVVDDVLAVSFDTWWWSPIHGFVIEFYHEGEITIGFFL